MRAFIPAMWHADVDYYRVTHRKGSGYEETVPAYAAAVDTVAGKLVLPSFKPSPWRWMGYHGWTFGSIAWGEGEQGALLQASGVAAAEVARLRLPYTGVPRLDIQVTYWLGADFPSLAWEVAGETNRARGRERGRPWAVRVQDGQGDGDTCYIGRRGGTSKYLRVYDKWREQDKSDAWRYAWRFEAELTNDHAEYALGTLYETPMEHHDVLALLAAYFKERGVTLPEVTGADYHQVPRIRKPPDDLARTIRWLEEQVRPAIDKAIGRGLTQGQVLSILGLGPQEGGIAT